jgi:uncharacterized alpha-E superfamily protein
MLSRVASHLYWMARYLERAENMARILDVAQMLALVSHDSDIEATIEPLVITDTLPAFDASGRTRTPPDVAAYLSWDAQHPSSIFNCLRSSRENARAVRAALTTEMWEDINATWLLLLQKRHQEREPADGAFFDWVKERSHLFRGITFATIRRDQPYHFIRLGTYIERADNTARILSVKQSMGATASSGNDVTDFYRLSAVLRSVSAFEAYRDAYREGVEERRVAELLILDRTVPRSLRFCFDQLVRILSELPSENAKPARRLAATMLANLEFGDVDDVHAQGYLPFLDRFIQQTALLGDAIHQAYLELK